ncbi:MAG: radical SAM protein [Thermodesulfobacteriota bacterium]|nr:radical SAM protein [Thermodesulfobacteriota bacterium]
MHYEGNIIRPPAEALSIILQVTVGCSHNKCTFCGAYKGVEFRIKDQSIIREDLEFARQYCRRQRRIFLTDGDVLILPQKRLVDLFKKIREMVPWVNRISLYGNTKSIKSKTVAQLKELKHLGLDRVYMGLETGHDRILTAIRKGADSKSMIEAGRKVRESGLFLCITVLLGIGGIDLSIVHAEATGEVLTRMVPNQISVLTLILLENTSLYSDYEKGIFHMPDTNGMLEELKALVSNIHADRVQFQSNHASNYLPIKGRLSRDKGYILDLIDQAISGKIGLKPEHMRAL